MAVVQLSDMENFIIIADGSACYGGDQDWPKSVGFRNEAACGATTAANMLGYFVRTCPELSALSSYTPDALAAKEHFIHFMEQIYPYVQPTVIGVMPGDFTNGVAGYAREKGFVISAETLVVPSARRKRPSDEETARFIAEAFANKLPIAFLNLSNGSVKNLDSYHWVTIVSIDADAMTAEIIDNGQKLPIDLGKWLRKSTLGGAFVVLKPHA
jgi:hypothetical protein